MEIEYKFKVQTSEISTGLQTSGDPRSSDVYIGKNQDWLTFDIEFNKELNLTLQPLLFSKEVFNDRIEYKLNTSDVLLTDIKIGSDLYFYEVISSKTKSINQLKTESDTTDILEYDGKFYSNTSFYIYNSDDDFIYTKEVKKISDFEVVYDFDYIQLITEPNVYLKLKTDLINPKVVNEFCFYIPTFYLENYKTGITYRCIESNIKEFIVKSNTKKNNFFKYQCIADITGISTNHNIHFLNTVPENLLFRSSSHYFKNLKSTSYYSISSEGSIKESDKNNYIFKISKKLNFSNIVIIPNTYKIERQKKVSANNFVNSLREVNPNLNDYGIDYRNIHKGYPVINYVSLGINNIYTINSSMEIDPRVTEISMKESNQYLRAVVDYEDNQIYKQLDTIKYYKKETDPYDGN